MMLKSNMDLTKLKVSVIGCGWLGKALCNALLEAGSEVITSASTLEKAKKLATNYNIHFLDIRSEKTEKLLLDSDVIIYTIPPLGYREVEKFFHAIAADQKILFISSTSVYGKSSGLLNEDSAVEPENESGRRLVQSENYLRKHFKNVTILRLGGLIGVDRHPVTSLQGKKNLTNGHELIHLVHRDDCINAIISVIEKNIWNETINLINDLKVPKFEYYTSIAKSLGLIPPEYIETPILSPTKISNEKSKILLSLSYKNI